MILKQLKVYHYFWVLSVIILIIGFYRQNSPDSIINLNIHDTYYVITDLHLSIILASSYLLLGFGYWIVISLLKRKLIIYLTLIHCVILFGSFIVYWIVYFYSNVIVSKPFPLFDNFALINQILTILILLIVFIGQPIYFVNLLIGILRKRVA